MSIYDDDWQDLFQDFDDDDDRGSLAWLGELLVLLSAALVLVGLPWLIVAVLT